MVTTTVTSCQRTVWLFISWQTETACRVSWARASACTSSSSSDTSSFPKNFWKADKQTHTRHEESCDAMKCLSNVFHMTFCQIHSPHRHRGWNKIFKLGKGCVHSAESVSGSVKVVWVCFTWKWRTAGNTRVFLAHFNPVFCERHGGWRWWTWTRIKTLRLKSLNRTDGVEWPQRRTWAVKLKLNRKNVLLTNLLTLETWRKLPTSDHRVAKQGLNPFVFWGLN